MNPMRQRLIDAPNAVALGAPSPRVMRAAGKVDSFQGQLVDSILQELVLADDATLEAFASAMDEAESAEMGEPSPWRSDLVEQYKREQGADAWEEWRQDRLTLVRTGLRAMVLAITSEAS